MNKTIEWGIRVIMRRTLTAAKLAETIATQAPACAFTAAAARKTIDSMNAIAIATLTHKLTT
jgi:hypothetical protein